MDINEYFNRLNLQSDALIVAIVALALLLVLFLNRKRIQVGWREWRIQRSLGRIGSEQIRGLVCDDGLDGHYKIDRLALTPNSILLIAYRPYVGNIYCAESISEWTQVIGQKSFKFENPLFEIENQLTSLRLLIGDTPVRGYLFFNHSAEFPKGHPDAVLTPDNIPDEILSTSPEKVPAEIRAAWELLITHQKGAAENERVGVKT
ncbi:MAG: nuclease-related domain-containing protein [Gammaproteobacteria bacterium]|jgi:hypothetical protein